MPQPAALEVVEFTDVSCPWVWGSEPRFRLLRWRYGDCPAVDYRAHRSGAR